MPTMITRRQIDEGRDAPRPAPTPARVVSGSPVKNTRTGTAQSPATPPSPVGGRVTVTVTPSVSGSSGSGTGQPSGARSSSTRANTGHTPANSSLMGNLGIHMGPTTNVGFGAEAAVYSMTRNDARAENFLYANTIDKADDPDWRFGTKQSNIAINNLLGTNRNTSINGTPISFTNSSRLQECIPGFYCPEPINEGILTPYCMLFPNASECVTSEDLPELEALSWGDILLMPRGIPRDRGPKNTRRMDGSCRPCGNPIVRCRIDFLRDLGTSRGGHGCSGTDLAQFHIETVGWYGPDENCDCWPLNPIDDVHCLADLMDAIPLYLLCPEGYTLGFGPGR